MPGCSFATHYKYEGVLKAGSKNVSTNQCLISVTLSSGNSAKSVPEKETAVYAAVEAALKLHVQGK